ncbi:MAG: glycosyltransferase [Cytophagales bacterium]|nr:glycosyltransferase [Armatimonadota bacterium]
MRVGLFTESYDPVINGVSTSVKTLAMELAQAGHHPVVVAPRYPDFDDAAPGTDGITVLRLPSWRTPFNPQNPFAYPPRGPVPSVLREARFDVVHTQQPFGMGRHGRACARRLAVPLISTFHTLYTEYAHYFPLVPRSMVRWWLGDQLRHYYQTCDAVVIPSRAAGKLLGEIGVPAQRLKVVPTGVSSAPMIVPAAVEQARRGYSLPPAAPVLLFVGRLAREKNLDLLLGTFTQLCLEDWLATPPEEHPILLLVGSGPYLDACRERVRRDGIGPWVRFAGFLRRNELASVYALSTLFVFPSSTETQGVVLSEAQSFGLPCVLTEGGGAPEFVQANVDALVVPPVDTAFAEGIRCLLTDPIRRRAFAAAALQSPLRPTPAIMVHRLLELYRATKEARSASHPLTDRASRRSSSGD